MFVSKLRSSSTLANVRCSISLRHSDALTTRMDTTRVTLMAMIAAAVRAVNKIVASVGYGCSALDCYGLPKVKLRGVSVATAQMESYNGLEGLS